MLLVTLSAAILFTLGFLHLVLTYVGQGLHPRRAELVQEMQGESLRLERSINFWKAWIGFNASHSTGLMLFGAFYGYLSLVQPELLAQSPFLRILGLLTLLGYWLMAKFYFFRTPLLGISLASILYVVGFLRG